MVDPWVLANDVIGNIGGLVLTPLLWLGLFLWAWSRPNDARESGFGRMAFWLLLPGAILSSLADAPFLSWAGDVLAINIGGALIPIVLTLVLLHRELGSARWGLTGLVILIVAAETAVQFAIVLVTPSQWRYVLGLLTLHRFAIASVPASTWTGVFVLVTAAGAVALSAMALPRWIARPQALRALTFVSLVSAAILLTFFSSQAIPTIGIVSQFPYYLIGPVLVGALAAWVASAVWGVPAYRGLGLGYGSGTLGTLIGADILRQPPLYTGVRGELLAIGGAGVQDLVYFSGLMAMGAGLLLILLGSRWTRSGVSAPVPASLSPERSLRAAAESFAKGDAAGVIRDSAAASERAVDRARAVFQLPPTERAGTALDGLPVAPYVANDYRNLLSSTEVPAPTPREAYRSLVMATQFVRLGKDLSRLRFAAPRRRAWAAVIDLLVITAPAVLLWVILAETQPGGVEAILVGLPFNLAVIAYVAFAVLYYVVCDTVWGATVGKLLLHLAVTDRAWARPTTLQSFLREAPKVVPLFVIGEFGGPALLFLLHPGSGSFSAFGVALALTGAVLLGIVVLTVAAAMALGGIQVARDSERQRLGDRWASTWVVDRRTITPAWGATQAPAVAPPEAVPPS